MILTSTMKAFLERIMEKSGLNELEAKFYYPFYKSADINDNLIMYGDAKSLVGKILNKEPNGQTVEDTYQYFLELFKEKNLIEKEDNQQGYPICRPSGL